MIDLVANIGCNGSGYKTFQLEAELPRLVHEVARLDRLGFLVFRKCKVHI